MTNATPAAVIHSQASINVRSVVLPRAKWEITRVADGRMAAVPRAGTWFAHILRSRNAMTVVPMIGCPNCGGLLLLSHDEMSARELRLMTGLPVPVAHRIDKFGKVSPDVLCKHGRCDFHRRVYLDRWQKTKPLYAIAYVNCDRGEHGEIEIAYSHALNEKEARMHLGFGNFRIIGAGPAIGFFVDEKTGRATAEMH
jgi:hypothetical protein